MGTHMSSYNKAGEEDFGAELANIRGHKLPKKTEPVDDIKAELAKLRASIDSAPKKGSVMEMASGNNNSF